MMRSKLQIFVLVFGLFLLSGVVNNKVNAAEDTPYVTLPCNNSTPVTITGNKNTHAVGASTPRNAVDLYCNNNQEVRSVASGTVKTWVQSNGKVVRINDGKYCYWYVHLTSVNVGNNQVVNGGVKLGTHDDHLHFAITPYVNNSCGGSSDSDSTEIPFVFLEIMHETNDSHLHQQFVSQNNSKGVAYYEKVIKYPDQVTTTTFNNGNEILMNIVTTDAGGYIHTASLQGDSSWTNWHKDGWTEGYVTSEVFNNGSINRLYQAHRGTDNKIYTRYSTDGRNWTSWMGEWNGGTTSSNVQMVSFNGNLYQFIKGSSSNTIYFRSTSDGNTWINWQPIPLFLTTGDIHLEVYLNKLFIAFRDVYGKVRTFYTTDLQTWTPSGDNLGETDGKIVMQVVQNTSGNYLYQTVRGNSTGKVFRRVTSNGGQTWSSWVQQSNGETVSDVHMEAYQPGVVGGFITNQELHQALVGITDSQIFNRKNDEGWQSASGKTYGNIELEVFPYMNTNRLYQVIMGRSGDTVYYKYTDNGINWTGWYSYGLQDN